MCEWGLGGGGVGFTGVCLTYNRTVLACGHLENPTRQTGLWLSLTGKKNSNKWYYESFEEHRNLGILVNDVSLHNKCRESYVANKFLLSIKT